jgi:hypothetical protein
MPENLKTMIEHALPFMVAASNGQGPQLNIPRILEAVIIAAVLGAGAWMLLIPELKTEFSYMKRDIQNVSDKVEHIQRDVNKLKIDVAVDKARHNNDK